MTERFEKSEKRPYNSDRGGRGGDRDRGDRGDRGGRGGDRDGARRKGRNITADPEFMVDYKKPHFLQAYITEHGKIVPRRISGVTAKEQRRITVEVKRSRQLGLLAYTSNAIAQ